jgi:hypothetical protein
VRLPRILRSPRIPRIPRIPRVVVVVVGMLACGGSAWDMKGAPKSPPDEQFRTGVEVGYDAWLWHCYEGHRVLVTQSGSACFGTGRPQMQSGPCGASLAGESAFPEPIRRHEIPDGYRWPGSKPDAPPVPDTPDASSALRASEASDAAR